MRTFTNLRIKIRNFFKKNKIIIFIVIGIWALLFILNKYLANMNIEKVPITTYDPHVSVMDSTSSVPKELQDPISNIIDEFIGYCNNKEYEKAYNLLSEECKNNEYSNIKDFEKYVNRRFPNKKLYCIQDYSNLNGKYIYQVKIYDDFLSTGLTVEKDSNNELKISVGKYIETTDIKSVAEDDYLKIDIKNKTVKYDSEVYHLKITNRSEYTVVIADNNIEAEEIVISLGSEYRNRAEAYLDPVILQPGESKEYDFTFTKFYDDGDTSQYMIFNAIRVMENYTGSAETAEEEIENAKTKYSLKIKI